MGSMRLKKMGAWIQYSGPGGRAFYFNEETGFFQVSLTPMREGGVRQQFFLFCLEPQPPSPLS